MYIIFLFYFLFKFFCLISTQKINLTKHCGLPSNFNELPDFAQDEIQSVWKNYIPGNKCEKELQITEDILSVLITFEKELKKEQTTKIFNKQLNKKQNNILKQENERKNENNDYINDYLNLKKRKNIPSNNYENEENYNIGIINEYEENNNYEQKNYFKIKDLPFLKGLSPDIVDLFRKVINDPEFPTEKKRLEEIQLLAVSYLNEHQLNKFDIWATKYRNKLHELKNIENKSEEE